MSAKLPVIKEPHPQPLPASGEGRQSVALAGWGSWGLVSSQADMILLVKKLPHPYPLSFKWNVSTTTNKKLIRFLDL
jgi:hypothetical protein